MRRRLPPLSALRAFEAAGRNLSIARAAEELSVTPGAISRQIRALEDYLGVPLFERNHREVKLTAASSAYVSSLTEVFDDAERATRRMVRAHRRETLHVYSSITFTLRWLVPHLASFRAKYPDQEIQLTAALPSALDFDDGDVDVAIQSITPPPEMISHRLIEVEFVPVCSAKLLAESGPLTTVADLGRMTLLSSVARGRDWENWLAAAGYPGLQPHHSISFENSILAYQAALEGIGVAIGRRFLIADDLASGRLVAPLDFVLRDGSAFHIVYSPKAASNPQVIQFRDWAFAEVEAMKLSA
jgi:LysR family transcriptional regulator, glycine cleavage system transcriptional activator